MAENKKHKHPKNNLMELQKAYQGSRFVCIARTGAEDVAVAVLVEELGMDAAIGACAGLDDIQASILTLQSGEYQMRADCRIARCLSLFAFDENGADKLSGYHAGVFGFPKQPLTFLVYQDTGDGAISETPVLDDFPLIPFPVFQEAIREALDKGSIRISKTALARGHKKWELYSYYLVVRLGLVRASIRLDIACAALKITGTSDIYGEEIIGATVDRRDARQKNPRWYIVYDMPGGELDEDEVANIDHVVPRAKGGSLALRNLQLMKTRSNGLKGDLEDDALNQDRRKSARIIQRLVAGVDAAAERGEISPELKQDIQQALDFELGECTMPERGHIRTLLDHIASWL